MDGMGIDIVAKYGQIDIMKNRIISKCEFLI